MHSILKDRREDGANVRVILDRSAHTRKDIKKLELYANDSIDVRFFHRPSWILDYVCPPGGVHRDHRKILLIDGKTAYMGGRNIQVKYFNTWKDIDIRINGPAVYDLGMVYMENQQRVAPELPPVKITEKSARKAVVDTLPAHDALQGVTIQIVPDNPWDKRLPIRNSFEWSVNHAREYFYYYSPYAPPPKSSLRALKDAAKRGVDVRWIVPAHNDIPPAKWIGEAVYLELLDAGVRIFEWQGSMMHAKEFITDDYLVSIGSANIDNLSFFLNMEVSALLYDKQVSVVSRDLYLKEIQGNCLEITLEDARNWNIAPEIPQLDFPALCRKLVLVMFKQQLASFCCSYRHCAPLSARAKGCALTIY